MALEVGYIAHKVDGPLVLLCVCVCVYFKLNYNFLKKSSYYRVQSFSILCST